MLRSPWRAPAAIAALAALAAVATTQPLAAADLTVDEIVAKHIAARGGKEKIQSVQSAVFTGKMAMGQMEAPIILQWQRPNKVRMEFTLQGMTGIQAYDGTTGWMVMPFLGKKDPEAMTADDLKDVQEMADAFEGPLVDYAAKGHTVELVGKEKFEGTDAYRLKLTRASGDVSHVFIDAEAFLEIGSESKRKTPQGEVDFESTQSDYTEVDGLLFATSIHSKPKGAPAGQSISIDKIQLNQTIDGAVFTMPKVEPKPAEAKQ